MSKPFFVLLAKNFWTSKYLLCFVFGGKFTRFESSELVLAVCLFVCVWAFKCVSWETEVILCWNFVLLLQLFYCCKPATNPWGVYFCLSLARSLGSGVWGFFLYFCCFVCIWTRISVICLFSVLWWRPQRRPRPQSLGSNKSNLMVRFGCAVRC